MKDGLEEVRKINCMIAKEFRLWVCNTRLIIVVLLMVFIYEYVSKPLIECSVAMGGKLNFFEPAIAISNSDLLMLLIPFAFLVLMADFPQGGKSEFFFFARTTKRIWLVGQILFSGLASVTFVIALCLFSCLTVLPYAELSGSFSRAVMQYGTRFPEKSNGTVARLLPRNLFNQMSLAETIVHSVLLLIFLLWLLSLILLFCAILHSKIAGIVSIVFLVSLGVALVALETKAMWCFPVANAIAAIHLQEYLRKPIFPLWGSYVYLLLFIFGLLVCTFVKVRSYQPGRM